MKRTALRTLFVGLGVLVTSGACLSIDSVPVDDDACAERDDPDPLVGKWKGEGVCEFFANGRYSDDCGLTSQLWGYPEDWSRLEPGRYYFGTSSLGSHATECIGDATFASQCDEVTLELMCDGHEQVLHLERR